MQHPNAIRDQIELFARNEEQYRMGHVHHMQRWLRK
jgi:hypothetical protein